MNINYKHTIIGHVLTFIDYFLKGFTKGAYFNEKFLYEWYNNNSDNYSNSIFECNDSLQYHVIIYLNENKIDIKYCTNDGINKDILLNEKE